MRWWLMAVWLAVAGSATAGPCLPGATVALPLTYVLEDEVRGFLLEAIQRTETQTLADAGLVPYAEYYPAIVAARQADLPPALADLPYLAVLVAQGQYADPLYALTYAAESTVLPQIAEALDRLGLPAEADLVRVPLGIYPDWEAGVDARLQALIASGEGLPTGVKGVLYSTSAGRLHRASSRINAAVLQLIASDPTVATAYEAKRQAVPVDERIWFLTNLLAKDCVAGWWSPSEADAAYAAMGQAQADLALMDLYLLEAFNGSVHQYFYNSSGTMAPQLADVLDRAGLPGHAQSIRDGIAMFPAPYPRNTEARRAVMAGFNADQDAALEALTVWADDGMILDAMARVAEDAGLMPR